MAPIDTLSFTHSVIGSGTRDLIEINRVTFIRTKSINMSLKTASNPS